MHIPIIEFGCLIKLFVWVNSLIKHLFYKNLLNESLYQKYFIQ